VKPIPVKEPDSALYEVFPLDVLEFNDEMSAVESRVTVDLVAACAEVSAPAENAPARRAVDAAVAKARSAKFLFILIYLLLVWTSTGHTSSLGEFSVLASGLCGEQYGNFIPFATPTKGNFLKI
jgi:hypothetical protein